MSDSEKVNALIGAVQDLLRSASWYPDDEYAAPEMTVSSQAVIACDLACAALVNGASA